MNNIISKNNNRIFVSVVVPAYNEEARIGKSIERIVEFLKERGYLFELILIDDGSTDNTINILKKYKNLYEDTIHILCNNTNQGKGASVKKGMLYAKGDIVLFTDADLSTPIEEFEKLKISLLEKKFDIAIGSRNIEGSERKIPQRKIRSSMGKIFSYIVRYLMFSNILDSQCGFKAFKKHCVKNIFSKQTIRGFGFDPEILYIALKQGYTIDEVPVIWENDTMSKVNIISDPIVMIFNLIILKIKILFYKKSTG